MRVLEFLLAQPFCVFSHMRRSTVTIFDLSVELSAIHNHLTLEFRLISPQYVPSKIRWKRPVVRKGRALVISGKSYKTNGAIAAQSNPLQ